MRRLAIFTLAAGMLAATHADAAGLFGSRRAKAARKLPAELGKFVTPASHRTFTAPPAPAVEHADLTPYPEVSIPRQTGPLETPPPYPATTIPRTARAYPTYVPGQPAKKKPMVVEPAPVQTIHLYHNVVVKDRHNIHPCAVPKIVSVLDPCWDPKSCCPPRCVYVKICVPPCGCAKPEIKSGGREVEYDYGKYEVEIKSKNGVIVIDYDD